MAYYVKVIPPSKRARIHFGHCRHCRDGKGQVNQDRGTGPTYWSKPFSTFRAAKAFMDGLGFRGGDTGACRDCKPNEESDR